MTHKTVINNSCLLLPPSCLCLCLFACLSVCLSFICLYACLLVLVSVYPFCLYVCRYISCIQFFPIQHLYQLVLIHELFFLSIFSIYLSLILSVSLYICLWVSLPVSLVIYLSTCFSEGAVLSSLVSDTRR